MLNKCDKPDRLVLSTIQTRNLRKNWNICSFYRVEIEPHVIFVQSNRRRKMSLFSTDLPSTFETLFTKAFFPLPMSHIISNKMTRNWAQLCVIYSTLWVFYCDSNISFRTIKSTLNLFKATNHCVLQIDTFPPRSPTNWCIYKRFDVSVSISPKFVEFRFTSSVIVCY